MSLTRQYFKYVSQNIFGLLGTSCYILADTYFISQAAGTERRRPAEPLPAHLQLHLRHRLDAGPRRGHPLRHPPGAGRRARRSAISPTPCSGRWCSPCPSCWRAVFCPEVLLRLMGGDCGDRRARCGVRPHLPAVHALSSCATTSSHPSSATTATPRWRWWRRCAAASSMWCSTISSCSPWASACPARRWRRRCRRC